MFILRLLLVVAVSIVGLAFLAGAMFAQWLQPKRADDAQRQALETLLAEVRAATTVLERKADELERRKGMFN
jgi:hypothetical protein